MAEPAEIENPEPPRTKKPRRQCHFDPSWVQNDAEARKVHTNERVSLSHSTIVGLMSFKFNNVACCFDPIFSDELLTS